MVAEAERNNMIVAAHCHGNNSIVAALRAGCKTIEHATFLEDDAVELMVEKDAMLIATRTTLEMAIQHPEAWTPAQYEVGTLRVFNALHHPHIPRNGNTDFKLNHSNSEKSRNATKNPTPKL